MRRLTYILMSTSLLVLRGIAQEEKSPYRGIVTDKEGNAVEYATALLLRDSAQVGGAVSDAEGRFVIEAPVGRHLWGGIVWWYVAWDTSRGKRRCGCLPLRNEWNCRQLICL